MQRILVPVLVLAALLCSQRAAAAPLEVDLDGDGTLDRVTLTETSVTVTIGKQDSVWRSAAKLDSYVDARATAIGPLILVKSAAQGIVLGFKNRAIAELLRAPIGQQDEDGELIATIRLDADGVLRGYERPDIRGCDNQLPLLFGERWLSNGTFAPHEATTAPSALQVTAQADARIGQATVFTKLAETYRDDASDARFLAQPSELIDGNSKTVWPKDTVRGKGARVIARSPWPSASAVAVLLEFAQPLPRPSRIAVTSGGLTRAVLLPAGKTAFSFAPPVSASCVEVAVIDLASPLAELNIIARGESDGSIDRELVSAIAKTNHRGALAVAQNRSKNIAPLFEQALADEKGTARAQLLSAFRTIDPSRASRYLISAIEANQISLADAQDAVDQLVTRKATTELAAVAASKHEANVYAANAFKQLGVDGGNAALALLTVGANQQGRIAANPIRRALIGAASLAEPSLLLAAVNDTTAKVQSRADAYAAAALGASPKSAVLAIARKRLNDATEFEELARIVALLVGFGDESDHRAVASDRNVAQMPPLRVVAARSARLPAANGLLATLLRDQDPGARNAAVTALAGGSGATSNPELRTLLTTILKQDRWSMVRQSAAAAAAATCLVTSEAIVSVIRTDSTTPVRVSAFAALESCYRTDAIALSERLWTSAKQPLAVKQAAIDLGVTEPRLLAALVGQLKRWRSKASDAYEPFELASYSTVALGKAGATSPQRGAIAAELLSMIDDGALPELVAAAILGLGELGASCDGQAHSKIKAHSSDPSRAVSIAASKALAKCKTR